MKLSNFILTKVTGNSPLSWRFKATIDVTTGFLFKKTVTKEIYKEYGHDWYFAESGLWVEGIHAMVRVIEAKQGKPLEQCLTNQSGVCK